ncbi:MAG: lipopolysaccharide biosynthesis protein [Armatimonadota bacterium]
MAKSSAPEEPDGRDPQSSAEPAPADAQATSTSAGIAIVSSASYVGLIASVIRALVLANVLGPIDWGILAAVRLLVGYCGNSHLGMMHGLNKLMPLALGKEEHERAETLQNTAFTATTALAIAAGLTVCGVAFFDLAHLGATTRMALAVGGALVIGGHTTNFITCVLRTHGRFGVIGRALLLAAVAEFALSIGLGLLLGVRAAVAGFVLAQLAVLLYFLARARLRLAWRFRWPEIAALLKAGIPLMLMLLADQLYRTVDCLIIVKFIRVRAFGFYRLGSTLAGMLYTVPSSVAYVLFPEYMKTYGRDGAEGLRRQLLLATVGLASVMPVLAGVGYLLCPCVIPWLMPKYVEAIGAIQVLLLGSSVLAVPVAADQALVAFNREKHLIAFRGAGALVIAAATYALVHTALQGADLLRAIAIGACAGYAVTGTLSLMSAFAVYADRRADVVRETALSFLPLIFCLGALWASQRLAQAIAGHLGGPAMAAVSLPTFLLACAPLLLYLEHRTKLISRLVAVLLRRRRKDTSQSD